MWTLDFFEKSNRPSWRGGWTLDFSELFAESKSKLTDKTAGYIPMTSSCCSSAKELLKRVLRVMPPDGKRCSGAEDPRSLLKFASTSLQ